MVKSEAKTSDFLRDETSLANSTGNTPHLGDALDLQFKNQLQNM